MAEVEPEVDRFEQAVRFLLLLALWGVWLAFRAVWGLLRELASVDSRSLARRVVSWGILAGGLLLAPHAVGLWWSRMMLVDAAEIAALQAEGRDAADIETDLRIKAFRLGFKDILAQPGAVRVSQEDRGDGPVCKVSLDFHHQPKVYGWTTPPLRIRAKVERFVLPAPEGGWQKGLIEGL